MHFLDRGCTYTVVKRSQKFNGCCKFFATTWEASGHSQTPRKSPNSFLRRRGVGYKTIWGGGGGDLQDKERMMAWLTSCYKGR